MKYLPSATLREMRTTFSANFPWKMLHFKLNGATACFSAALASQYNGGNENSNAFRLKM